MKYIKKLNINFDDWEEVNNDDNILDKFFHQNKYTKCNNYVLSYLNSLLINKESIPYIKQYLIDKNLKVKWSSGSNLITLLKHFFNYNKEIYLVLGENNKMYKTLLYDKCYNVIDFRK